MTLFNDRRSVPMNPTKGTISHLKARQIAADWHGGQSSPLYALASSGAIKPGLSDEIERNIPTAETKRERKRLTQLGRYVNRTGQRGPVDGWHELNW